MAKIMKVNVKIKGKDEPPSSKFEIPVELRYKTRWWDGMCSECGFEASPTEILVWNYCPLCGSPKIKYNER